MRALSIKSVLAVHESKKQPVIRLESPAAFFMAKEIAWAIVLWASLPNRKHATILLHGVISASLPH